MIKIHKNTREDNILIKIRDNEDGYSGCLIFLLIVFVLIAAGAGYIYFQWSNIQKWSSQKVQKALKEVEENKKIESLEDVEDMNLEELKDIHPIVKTIVKFIPTGLISEYQEEINNNFDSSKKEESTKQNTEINPRELLPASIDLHPAMTLVDYQDLKEVPDFVIDQAKIEETFINKQSIFLEFEVDFPKREITELKNMEEVPEGITDSMIEEQKDELKQLYNLKEVLSWYQENLQKNNWETIKNKETEGFNYMYQHQDDGYFIILNLKNCLYTPKI